MSTIYDAYSDYVGSICSEKNLKEFKSNPLYTYMLEHVSTHHGKQYLEYIRKTSLLSIDDVIQFCTINDATGSPKKEEYPVFLKDVSVSPSSLRYIYHAHLILSHMKSLNSDALRDIVEIGGGYGGLCLAIHHLAPKYGVHINSYTICDLTNIIRLQELYLNHVNPNMNVNFVDAATYGVDIPHDNLFLISNYCFSEISPDHQAKYRQCLFSKVEHGFFVWNCIPVYDIGFNILHIDHELPNTGSKFNRYVWF